MACVWIEGAAFLAGHAKTTNSARAFGLLFTAGMTGDRSETPLPGRLMIPGMVPPPAAVDPHPPVSQDTLQTQQDQILFVEIAVFAWENAMYGVGGLLTLVGLFSFRGRLGRPLHLVAGVVILLSTVATLTTMILLTDPERGGLQPLSIISYLLVGTTQSAYGVILLVIFRRRNSGGCPERPFVAQ